MTPPPTVALRVTSRRLGALGLASVAIILAGMLIAAVPYRGYSGEGYSPLTHIISELGEINVSALAWAFNLGLVVGGAGLATFLLLLSDRVTGRHRPALIAAGLAAGISGTLVGVFPMDYHSVHRIVAFAFFLTGWLVAGIFSLWLVAAPRPGFRRWLILPGAIVATIFISFIAVYSAYRPADPDAHIIDRPEFWAVTTLEWASLLSLLGWFACVALVLLRERDAAA
jgi:hypothetical membrane protein